MYEFYENKNVFPHAFLIGEYRVIKDSEKIKELMFSTNFDLRKEAILESDPGIVKTQGNMGEAKIVSYKSNNIAISVNAREKSLLFLAENYYPGWHATIDGKNTPILRADYVFRAIPVEEGQHMISFYYEPWSFKLGVYISIGGMITILLFTLISRNINRRKSISS